MERLRALGKWSVVTQQNQVCSDEDLKTRACLGGRRERIVINVSLNMEPEAE